MPYIQKVVKLSLKGKTSGWANGQNIYNFEKMTQGLF